MADIRSELLHETDTASVWNVLCACGSAQPSEEECTQTTHLVFPYRGVFVSHVGRRKAVLDANQLLFMNAGEPFRISHPIAGGDDCLSLTVAVPLLNEIIPKALRGFDNGITTVAAHRLRIDPRAQALSALLRHGLITGRADPLEADVMAITLARRAFGENASHRAGGSWGRQQLVDRAKIALASDLARRWTLTEVGREVGVSPVYLTQLFQDVEGVPLYRYQLRLRLARALDLLPHSEDLTTLAFDLGFSSHSHFSAAFRRAYGSTPAEFRGLTGPSQCGGALAGARNGKTSSECSASSRLTPSLMPVTSPITSKDR